VLCYSIADVDMSPLLSLVDCCSWLSPVIHCGYCCQSMRCTMVLLTMTTTSLFFSFTGLHSSCCHCLLHCCQHHCHYVVTSWLMFPCIFTCLFCCLFAVDVCCGHRSSLWPGNGFTVCCSASNGTITTIAVSTGWLFSCFISQCTFTSMAQHVAMPLPLCH